MQTRQGALHARHTTSGPCMRTGLFRLWSSISHIRPVPIRQTCALRGQHLQYPPALAEFPRDCKVFGARGVRQMSTDNTEEPSLKRAKLSSGASLRKLLHLLPTSLEIFSNLTSATGLARASFATASLTASVTILMNVLVAPLQLNSLATQHHKPRTCCSSEQPLAEDV